jgi:hypothetical protein
LCYCQSREVRDAYQKELDALAGRNWIERLFDRREKNEKRDRDRAAGIGAAFVVLASPAGYERPRFVIWLDSQYLVVLLAEFSQRATVVGQVERLGAVSKLCLRATITGPPPVSALSMKSLHTHAI